METLPVIRLEGLIGRMKRLRRSSVSEACGVTQYAQKSFFLAHPLKAIEHALNGVRDDPVALQ